MEMEVKKSEVSKKMNKEGDEITTYKVQLAGSNSLTGYDKVKMTLGIESENRVMLEEWVNMDLGAKRNLMLEYLNHTLDEYTKEENIEA